MRSAWKASAILVLSAFALAACSSSSGGGSSPRNDRIIVLPAGQNAICANGSLPPC